MSKPSLIGSVQFRRIRLTLTLGFDLHRSRAAATLRPAGPAPTTATSSILKVLHASIEAVSVMSSCLFSVPAMWDAIRGEVCHPKRGRGGGGDVLQGPGAGCKSTIYYLQMFQLIARYRLSRQVNC